MRSFTVAAVQTAPVRGPLTSEAVKANVDNAVGWIERCVDATGAELLVLPDTCTTGFTPGLPAEALWDVVSAVRAPASLVRGRGEWCPCASPPAG